MRVARLLLSIGALSMFAAACTTGSTQVQGLPTGSPDTETTRPTGPTATGPTAATGATDGAFSLDFEFPPEVSGQVSDFAFFTCNGLEGTWRYIFQADFGQGIVFDIDAEVDMAGGDGTLVFGGQFEIAGAGSISFTDTIDLVLVGDDTLRSTSVTVEVDSNIPGIENFFQTFREGESLPIVPGSDRC
jgi:hypothetical protein